MRPSAPSSANASGDEGHNFAAVGNATRMQAAPQRQCRRRARRANAGERQFRHRRAGDDSFNTAAAPLADASGDFSGTPLPVHCRCRWRPKRQFGERRHCRCRGDDSNNIASGQERQCERRSRAPTSPSVTVRLPSATIPPTWRSAITRKRAAMIPSPSARARLPRARSLPARSLCLERRRGFRRLCLGERGG